MDTRLANALKRAEGNIYNGMSLLKGAIVFAWTLLCLFLINKSSSFIFSAASGAIYYISLVGLCMCLFKGIGRYMGFPAENKKMPVFIGHKLDIIFTYPLLLMAFIDLISSLLAVSGLFGATPNQADVSVSSGWTTAVRILLMPLTAFAEELLNLLLVSFIYRYLKIERNYRIITSVLFAALIFGLMHTFGQGVNAAIFIGIAYIPVFFATLYTGNIWISFLTHLYNDLIFLSKFCNSSLYPAIIASVSLIPVLWAVRAMFRKTS